MPFSPVSFVFPPKIPDGWRRYAPLTRKGSASLPDAVKDGTCPPPFPIVSLSRLPVKAEAALLRGLGALKKHDGFLAHKKKTREPGAIEALHASDNNTGATHLGDPCTFMDFRLC
jgi:hypothetical protein